MQIMEKSIMISTQSDSVTFTIDSDELLDEARVNMASSSQASIIMFLQENHENTTPLEIPGIETMKGVVGSPVAKSIYAFKLRTSFLRKSNAESVNSHTKSYPSEFAIITHNSAIPFWSAIRNGTAGSIAINFVSETQSPNIANHEGKKTHIITLSNLSYIHCEQTIEFVIWKGMCDHLTDNIKIELADDEQGDNKSGIVSTIINKNLNQNQK